MTIFLINKLRKYVINKKSKRTPAKKNEIGPRCELYIVEDAMLCQAESNFKYKILYIYIQYILNIRQKYKKCFVSFCFFPWDCRRILYRTGTKHHFNIIVIFESWWYAINVYFFLWSMEIFAMEYHVVWSYKHRFANIYDRWNKELRSQILKFLLGKKKTHIVLIHSVIGSVANLVMPSAICRPLF